MFNGIVAPRVSLSAVKLKRKLPSKDLLLNLVQGPSLKETKHYRASAPSSAL